MAYQGLANAGPDSREGSGILLQVAHMIIWPFSVLRAQMPA